jgi:hypothetical protein
LSFRNRTQLTLSKVCLVLAGSYMEDIIYQPLSSVSKSLPARLSFRHFYNCLKFPSVFSDFHPCKSTSRNLYVLLNGIYNQRSVSLLLLFRVYQAGRDSDIILQWRGMGMCEEQGKRRSSLVLSLQPPCPVASFSVLCPFLGTKRFLCYCFNIL